MSLSSTSAVVKAANSKLAIFLRTKEEEEALLRSLKVKPNKSRREGGTPGWSRWASPPDFRAPSPLVDRPRTAAGATSFHFAYESISKTAVPIGSDGQPITGPMARPQKSGVEHAKYIERDGAVEMSAGQAHAVYIERPEAREWPVSSAEGDDPEFPLLGPLESVAGKASVFTNISDDPQERIDFWRAVEERESNPRIHAIFLKPTNSPGWWEGLSITEALDEDFKAHALQVSELHRQHLAQGGDEESFEHKPFTCSAEKAGSVIEQAQTMPGLDPSDHPLWFRSGRGGRIQFRMVAELPHEISAEARAEIVSEFCDHIGSLEQREGPDGELIIVGMMYTAVIHAPDCHNDGRNYHLHIVAHDRPATIIVDEDGRREWDFAARVEYVTPRRQRRSKYKYPPQNKIRAVNGKDFIPSLRKKLSEITNRVLRKHGIKRFLDHRTYKEMGIERTPTRHLGNKAAALEAIGVPTYVGQSNAISIWGDAERALMKQVDPYRRRYESDQADFLTLGQLALQMDPDGQETNQFFHVLGSLASIVARIEADRLQMMTFDLNEAKAKSRATRTIRTCQAFLAEIEAGTADRTIKACRSQILDRLAAAEFHIGAIDAALAPHRESLAAAAEKLKLDERGYDQVTGALRSRLPVLRAIINHGGPLPSTDKKLPSLGEAKPLPAQVLAPILPPSQNPANVTPAAALIPEIPVNSALPTIKGQPISKSPLLEERGSKVGGMARERAHTHAQEELPSVDGGIKVHTDKIVSRTSETTALAPPLDTREFASRAGYDRRPEDAIDDTGRPNASRQAQFGISRHGDVAFDEVGTINGSDQMQALLGSESQSEPDAQHRAEQAAATSTAPSDNLSAGPKTITDAPDDLRRPGAAERTDPSDQNGLTKLGSKQTATLAGDKPDGSSQDESSIGKELPAVPASSLADWERIFGKIKDKKLLIERDPAHGIYSVQDLSAEECDILCAPSLIRRSQGRLAAFHLNQEREVARVFKWLEKHAADPKMLVLVGREARLGDKAPLSMRKLFHGWGGHPSIRGFLDTEHARRRSLSMGSKTARNSTTTRATSGQAAGRVNMPSMQPQIMPPMGFAAPSADEELKRLKAQQEALKQSRGR